MKYVVVYDVSEDEVRNRLARCLEGWGRRVQESVFECDLLPERLTELTGELEREIRSPENGNVRVYRVCATCLDASVGIGIAPPTPPSFMIV